MRPGMSRIVEFVVENGRWGVDIGWVREIVPVRGMTPLPNGIPLLAGLMNVRGDVVPVLDGEKALAGAGGGGGRTVLVLSRRDETFGLLIDAVSAIRSVDAGLSGLEAGGSSGLEGPGSGYVAYRVPDPGGGEWPVLDVGRLMETVAGVWETQKNEEEI